MTVLAQTGCICAVVEKELQASTVIASNSLILHIASTPFYEVNTGATGYYKIAPCIHEDATAAVVESLKRLNRRLRRALRPLAIRTTDEYDE